jgi:hypothetical protein
MTRPIRLPRPLTESETQHFVKSVEADFRGLKPKFDINPLTIEVNIVGARRESEVSLNSFVLGYLTAVFRNDF